MRTLEAVVTARGAATADSTPPVGGPASRRLLDLATAAVDPFERMRDATLACERAA
jgi:hypothetical protein